MAFDLYSSSDMYTGAVGTAVEQTRSRMKDRAKTFFGTSVQAERVMAKRGDINMNLILRSVATFGMENLMKGKQFLSDAGKKLDEELNQSLRRGAQARAENDTKLYAAELRRRTLLNEWRATKLMTQNARIGEIVTAIGYAAASIFGTVAGQEGWFKPQDVAMGTLPKLQTAPGITQAGMYQ